MERHLLARLRARLDVDAGERYLLLLQLSETVATALAPQLPSLAQLFRAALGDSERPVAVMALRACCAFVSTLSTDDDALLFKDLVPPMVAVATTAARDRDDAVLVAFFDAFAELAQTPVPVLAPHVAEVVPFLLSVAAGVQETPSI